LGTVATVGAPKLRVAGAGVLVAAGVVLKPVGGCQTPSVTGPPPSKPCTSVVSITSALSTKLFVGGKPVVIAPLHGTTDGVVTGTPQAALSAVVGKTLLLVSA
jgi:hypothetical protein